MTEDSTFLSTLAPRIAQLPGLTVNLEGLLPHPEAEAIWYSLCSSSITPFKCMALQS